MIKQIVFVICLLLTLSVFGYTAYHVYRLFKLTKSFSIGTIGKRIFMMLKIAIGQTKIFRFPGVGFMHALVFWGFCVVAIGTVEMVIDGIAGTEKCLSFLGGFYNLLMASGDVFAYVVFASVIFFLIRRLFGHIKRFGGIEMKHKSHLDANISLTIILILMLSLIGMNVFYCAIYADDIKGSYPISIILTQYITSCNIISLNLCYTIFWWTHILLIFIFANILPYSKHFHVFMSIPNVFFSRLEPLGKLSNMEDVTREVKMMLNPNLAFATAVSEVAPTRFGVKDAEDATWKNYMDSLSCTQCGRCTSVCPANNTGKKLSPRKVMMDLRARMKEIGPQLIKNGMDYTDNKSLIRDYISEEEIWACTTCNACAKECPININHPSFIVDMRRYLVMEESAAPATLNSIFFNIENNGAPWQFSPEDRMLWSTNIFLKKV